MAQRSEANHPRRKFLIQATSTAVAVCLPQLSLAKSNPLEARSLAFLNLHTQETLSCIYWKNNQLSFSALTKIHHILRDHRTQEISQIDPQLINLLYKLHTATQSKAPFEIISGYRSPKTNEALRKNTSGVAKRSLHMQGKAIDVRLADVDLRKFRDIAIELQSGGVGYYPKSGFLHIDTGTPRYW